MRDYPHYAAFFNLLFTIGYLNDIVAKNGRRRKTKVTRTGVTIYCHCANSAVITNRVKLGVLDAIKDAGIEFEAVPDLCKLSAERDGALKRWAKAKSIKIVACYPRAVKWLFYAGRAPLPKESVEFLNMRVDSIEKITSSLMKDSIIASCVRRRASCKRTQYAIRKTQNDWVPWFPVIDYDRCKNCKQCFNFCLFGVYELSEQGQVVVKNPANCKTNCPACARMCPQCAIIFPKYSDSPINGDEVNEQTLQDEKEKKGRSLLLGENIYDTIRQHSKKGKRFSKDAESSVLKKLQEKLDIPPEVLESLPPGQIAQLDEKSCKKEH